MSRGAVGERGSGEKKKHNPQKQKRPRVPPPSPKNKTGHTWRPLKLCACCASCSRTRPTRCARGGCRGRGGGRHQNAIGGPRWVTPRKAGNTRPWSLSSPPRQSRPRAVDLLWAGASAGRGRRATRPLQKQKKKRGEALPPFGGCPPRAPPPRPPVRPRCACQPRWRKNPKKGGRPGGGAATTK